MAAAGASTPDLAAIGERIEALLDVARASPDARAADRAEELVRLLSELYGGGLARIVELAEANAPDLVPQLIGDELVASLLVVHGLHPEGMVQRVEQALDSVRPLLAAHGGDVELLDVDEDVGAVRLQLLGSCDGCPSSSSTLQRAVEEAILAAAPEVAIIDVDDPTHEVPTGPGPVPIALGPRPGHDARSTEPAVP